MFIKYPHLERFGTDEVEDINIGKCYIFPKIDGSNSSLWQQREPEWGLYAGSRNRQLSLDSDNAGFYDVMINDTKYHAFFGKYNYLRLYGEWLVPHSVKTYREDAWKQFYIFDVLNQDTGEFLSYEEYKPLLEEFGLQYIPCQKIINNPTLDQLIHEVKSNTYLINEGQGIGEGIVVKQYGYKNRFGRTTWAKLISSSFREEHMKVWNPTEISNKVLEEDIVGEFCTKHLVDKVIDKIRVQQGEFRAQNIPQLLGQTFHDLVTEELWQILKKYKNPKIDFKMLNQFTIKKIKSMRPELF